MYRFEFHDTVYDFNTKAELIECLESICPHVIDNIKYWYVETNYDPDDMVGYIVDDARTGHEAYDLLDTALDYIEECFAEGYYTYGKDTVFGISWIDEDECEDEE